MIQYDRNRRRFAVALAALAGCVDAIGFLSANGYFVSFMSGNTTRLGVALGTAPWHALAPAQLDACLNPLHERYIRGPGPKARVGALGFAWI